MDPQITLEMAEDAIDSHDWDDARAALNRYAEWRNKGGFEPSGGDELFEELIYEYEEHYKAYKGARLDV